MKKNFIVFVALALGALSLAQAEAPFQKLDSIEHWHSTKTVDSGGWSIDEQGVIHLVPNKAGAFATKEKFLDFELVFEWKVAKGVNSGVFYRQAKGRSPEYQILDDANHVRGQWEVSRVGTLYDLYGRSDDSCVKPHGEWNTGRIIAQGNRLQHFLNGVKVVDVEVGSDDWNARFKQSKNVKDSAKTNWDFGLQEGTIWLQDHGGEVWYRNFRIRKL